MKYYILVDASYFIFYRVFALYNWWKLSHPDESADNLHENTEFVEKFKDVFVRKFEEIPKKLNLPKDADLTFIVARDCPRGNIWRKQIYPDYKATRGDHSKCKINPGPFFALTYKEELFEKTNFDEFVVLQHDYMEGDDCIAVTTRCIQKNMKGQDYHIYIIASDMDFFQLCTDDVSMRNLRFKDARTKKNSFFHPKQDLLYKIMVGDKSDNINPIFTKKCKQRATQLCKDTDELIKLLESDKDIMNHYMVNCFLIDFDKIPTCFIESVTAALEKRFFPKQMVFTLEDLIRQHVANQNIVIDNGQETK